MVTNNVPSDPDMATWRKQVQVAGREKRGAEGKADSGLPVGRPLFGAKPCSTLPPMEGDGDKIDYSKGATPLFIDNDEKESQ